MGSFLNTGDPPTKQRAFRARQILDFFITVAHLIHTQPNKYPGRLRRAYIKFLPRAPEQYTAVPSEAPDLVALVDQRYDLFDYLVLCLDVDLQDVDAAAGEIFRRNATRCAREADLCGQFDGRKAREIFERADALDRARLGCASAMYRPDVTRPGASADSFFKPFSDSFLSVVDFGTASLQFEPEDAAGISSFARWRAAQEGSAHAEAEQEGETLCPLRPGRRFALEATLARLPVPQSVLDGFVTAGEVRWDHGVTVNVFLSELRPTSFPDRLWPSLSSAGEPGSEPRGFFLGVVRNLAVLVPGTQVLRSSMHILEEEVAAAKRQRLIPLAGAAGRRAQRLLLSNAFAACFTSGSATPDSFLHAWEHLMAKCDNRQRFSFEPFPRQPARAGLDALGGFLRDTIRIAAHVYGSWQPHFVAGLMLFLRIKRPRENGVTSCAEVSGNRTPHMYIIGPPSTGKTFALGIVKSSNCFFTQSLTRQTVKSLDGCQGLHEEDGDSAFTTIRDEGVGRRFAAAKKRRTEATDEAVDEQNQLKNLLGEGKFRSSQKCKKRRVNGEEVFVYERTYVSNGGTYVFLGNERGTMDEAIHRRLTVFYLMTIPDRAQPDPEDWVGGITEGEVGLALSENATIATLLRAAATCRLLQFPFHDEGVPGSLAEAKRCWKCFLRSFESKVGTRMAYSQIQEQHYYMFVTDITCAFAAWRVFQCRNPLCVDRVFCASDLFEALPACESLLIPTNQACVAVLSFMLDALMPITMRILGAFAASDALAETAGRRTLPQPSAEPNGGEAQREEAKQQLIRHLAEAAFRFAGSPRGRQVLRSRIPCARDAAQVVGYFEDAVRDLMVQPMEGSAPLELLHETTADGFSRMRFSFDATWLAAFGDADATVRSILSDVSAGASEAVLFALAPSQSGSGFAFAEPATLPPRDRSQHGFEQWGPEFGAAVRYYCEQTGRDEAEVFQELLRAHSASQSCNRDS